LTTLPIYWDILKKLFQPKKRLFSLFVPYSGAKGGRDRKGDQPSDLILKKWNKNQSSVVYRMRGRISFL
jgi:hypothetical protein